MKVECPDEKKGCFGPYSGTRPPFKVPQYNPTLFEGKQSGAGVYDKMFDLAEDAAQTCWNRLITAFKFFCVLIIKSCST